LLPENIAGTKYLGVIKNWWPRQDSFAQGSAFGKPRSGTLTRLQHCPCGAVQILPGKKYLCAIEMWWPRQDLNLRPTGYEPAALTPELQGRTRVIRVSYYFVKSSRLIFSVGKTPGGINLAGQKCRMASFGAALTPELQGRTRVIRVSYYFVKSSRLSFFLGKLPAGQSSSVGKTPGGINLAGQKCRMASFGAALTPELQGPNEFTIYLSLSNASC